MRRLEDNIKTDLRKMGLLCGLDSLAQDRDQWLHNLVGIPSLA
jgi:hypothetical protein